MTTFARVLVVDDDVIVARAMAAYLQSVGYDAHAVHDAAAALRRIEQGMGDDAGPFLVMVADVSMPDVSGLDLIERALAIDPALVPIVITGYGTIESAVRSIRLGAIDYLTKPIIDQELRLAIEKAVRQRTLRGPDERRRRPLEFAPGLDSIVGVDERMRQLYETVKAVAPSRTTVLMCGESGTGKSLIARAIHRNSPRADGPFVEISCGSIPDTLLESELFGHVRGAFTGAHTDKPGRFKAAHGGTLFLDEINSASPGMQLKLLRVIQERALEPVGSHETIEVDVRIVLASNQPLEDLVARGEFRQDLYYRINVVTIELPPLRDRVSDIPLLAEHFLVMKSEEAGRQIIGFSDEAMAMLRQYPFPGNARELENLIERAVVLTRSPRIGVDDLPPHVRGETTSPLLERSSGNVFDYDAGSPVPLREALEEPERRIILAALQANHWNRQQTADQLGINRTTLYKKIKQYGLERFGATG